MGCVKSSKTTDEPRQRIIRIRRPRPWRHHEVLTRDELIALREQFWEAIPLYGGRQAIWDALRAAAESDTLHTAQEIIDNARIVVHVPDLTVCFDDIGTRYELPLYVLSDPTNMIHE